MPLRKYYWAYLGLYWLFNIILLLVSLMVEFNSSLSFLTAFIAAIVVGQLFVKDHRRAPNAVEKKRLVWASLAISWGSSLCLTLVALAFMAWAGEDMAFFSQIFALGGLTSIVLVALVVLLAISYGMIRWAYGGITTRMAATSIKNR